ncbi:MAG: hypothetical protein WA865_10460 [Spirulinaceae cyanobacterium]
MIPSDKLAPKLGDFLRWKVKAIANASLGQAKALDNIPLEMKRFLLNLETEGLQALQFTRSIPGLGTALVGMKSPQYVQENLTLTKVAPLKARDYEGLFRQ